MSLKKIMPASKNYSFLLVILSFAFLGFSFFSTDNVSFITKSGPENCDSVPALNKKILEFVQSKMNQKVGMGECWDLAAEALNYAGAKWDQEYKFGRQIDPSKECVLAGDIVQFSKIKIEYKENNVFYREDLSHHTAIIYEVIAQDNFILAEQNTGKLGQKVGTSPLVLKTIKSGKYKIYRPVK
jgi:hypothetical protein